MRRAAVSISSNLAEGSSRVLCADFARFVEIATGSLFEVVSQTITGKRQGFIGESNYAAVDAAAEKQSKMLSGLRKSFNNVIATQRFTLNPQPTNPQPSLPL